MVHLFLNCDEYLTSLKVAELKAALGDPEFASLNLTELAGDRTPGPEILALASLMPFLSERRMVIATGFFKALHRRGRTGKRQESGSPAPPSDPSDAERQDAGTDGEEDSSPTVGGAVYQDAAAFILGLRHVPDHADLVIIDENGPLTRGFRLPNAIDGESAIPALNTLGRQPGFVLHALSAPQNGYRGDDLTQWILAEAKRRNIAIEYEAARLLAEFVGPDLRRLGHELEKLALFRPGHSIVERQVRAQVADTSEERYYKLTTALNRRNAQDAFRVLADLWRADENPFGLLSAIASNFRTILRVKALMQQGTREPAEIARALEFKGSGAERRARGLVEDAGRFLSYSELENILERCFETNMAMISGEDQATHIELLIADLTLQPPRRAA